MAAHRDEGAVVVGRRELREEAVPACEEGPVSLLRVYSWSGSGSRKCWVCLSWVCKNSSFLQQMRKPGFGQIRPFRLPDRKAARPVL